MNGDCSVGKTEDKILWLDSRMKSSKTCMYDLYESYLIRNINVEVQEKKQKKKNHRMVWIGGTLKIT